MNWKSLASLISLALMLGCTGGGTNIASSSDPGVMVTQFYADQEVLRPGQMTEITAQVSNAGGHRAQNVEVTLFRMGELEISGDGDTSAKRSYSFGELEPADPASDTPAERKEHTWQIKAPSASMIHGRQGYNLGVQLTYDYTSDGWADLVVSKKEQAKVEGIEAGKAGSSVGPIGVAAFAPPVLLYDGEDSQHATVRIDLQNMGAGHASCSRAKDKGVNRLCRVQLRVPELFLDIDATTGALYTESPVTGGVEIELEELQDDKVIGEGGIDHWYCKPLPEDAEEKEEIEEDESLVHEYLWEVERVGGDIILTKDISNYNHTDSLELMRGRERSLVCYFKVKEDAVGLQQVIPIRAEAKYTYASEAALMIQVEGGAK